MRVLLATIGSRGEVQPIVALALRLIAHGHRVRVCVPPDFLDWTERLGIPSVALGPSMRPDPAQSAPTWDLSTPAGRRQAAESAVAAQFDTLPEAARGCDVLVACGAVMVAARSAAELVGIDYVHAHFCPATLPSAHHAPAPWPGWPQDDTDATGDNRERWAADRRLWRDVWGGALNAHRASVGLGAVEDVRGHVLTNRPWLAADPALGPWPDPDEHSVIQTGAWLVPDERPLPAELADFLAAGEPPVYFGLGSMPAPGTEVSAAVVAAIRKHGRRAIISRGWANLGVDDTEVGPADCLVIGEVNHQALFPRVAAVVHHGGAGTTTAAARAGVPQVVVPQVYDQHYWAARVQRLGIGVAHPPGMPTTPSLTTALGRALEPEVAARAQAFADEIRTDGTEVAARLLSERVPA